MGLRPQVLETLYPGADPARVVQHQCRTRLVVLNAPDTVNSIGEYVRIRQVMQVVGRLADADLMRMAAQQL
jgi:hypothetical protein